MRLVRQSEILRSLFAILQNPVVELVIIFIMVKALHAVAIVNMISVAALNFFGVFLARFYGVMIHDDLFAGRNIIGRADNNVAVFVNGMKSFKVNREMWIGKKTHHARVENGFNRIAYALRTTSKSFQYTATVIRSLLAVRAEQSPVDSQTCRVQVA